MNVGLAGDVTLLNSSVSSPLGVRLGLTQQLKEKVGHMSSIWKSKKEIVACDDH